MVKGVEAVQNCRREGPKVKGGGGGGEEIMKGWLNNGRGRPTDKEYFSYKGWWAMTNCGTQVPHIEGDSMEDGCALHTHTHQTISQSAYQDRETMGGGWLTQRLLVAVLSGLPDAGELGMKESHHRHHVSPPTFHPSSPVVLVVLYLGPLASSAHRATTYQI